MGRTGILFERKTGVILGLSTAMFILIIAAVATYVSASPTSTFTQVINPGSLSTNIVNGSYTPVGSPTVAMSSVTFSTSCQSSTGTFGTASEQLYVENPDAADNGWSVTLAASAPTDIWDSSGTDFDFNDASGSGCTDGGDTDSFGGQMTVDPSGGTLAVGQCGSCATTSVTKGSSASYEEGVTNSITILTGAAGSDDIGDWTL
ncbi:MAG TPA: hypothetical protein ENI23_08595, partial [bacterium]|nr:hypothetical protein [bacterium]